MQTKTVQFDLHDYQNAGMYIVLKDSTRLALTPEIIEQTALRYWSDPAKIPGQVKVAADFQRCTFCPQRDEDGICAAIRPVLPLLDQVDRYVSWEPVTAICRHEASGLWYVADTTMQHALTYVALLSLTEYCASRARFAEYLRGAIPMSEPETIVNQWYLNLYWLHRGDSQAVARATGAMRAWITAVTTNQIARLALICKHDAFLNAYVNAQNLAELLDMERDEGLRRRSTPAGST